MSKNAPGRVATEENQPFARPSGGRPAARSFAATRAVAAAVSGDEPLVPPTVCSDASVTTGHPGEMSASALTSGRVRLAVDDTCAWYCGRGTSLLTPPPPAARSP